MIPKLEVVVADVETTEDLMKANPMLTRMQAGRIRAIKASATRRWPSPPPTFEIEKKKKEGGAMLFIYSRSGQTVMSIGERGAMTHHSGPRITLGMP